MIDALPAVVGYWDKEMRNVVANRAYLDFYGLRPDAEHPLTIEELLGPEQFNSVRHHIEAALAGEPQEFEETLIGPTGRTRYIHAFYIPDVVDGEVRGFAVLVTDVTPRRLAEQARERAEARFKLAYNASPVPMALFDRRGFILGANPAMSQLLGYEETELLGRLAEDVAAPSHRERERERIESLLNESPESTSVELQLLHKDGSPIWVIASFAFKSDEDRDRRLGIVHVQDISARKRAEDELRLSQTRLNEAEQIAQLGSWEWDIRTDRVTWSKGLFRLLSIDPEEFSGHFDAVMERIYPDDREMMRETLDRTLAERSSFAIEFRALRGDGRVRTMRGRGEVVVDELGEPVRMVGIAQDVTDAKLAQEALQTTSADLERRAVELQKLAVQGAPERRVEVQAPLTPRQLEILRLIAKGNTSGEIAEELIITEGTVKWHVKQILAKTGSSSRAEAVARVLGTDV